MACVLTAGNELKNMNSKTKEVEMIHRANKTETCECCGNNFSRTCEPESYIGNNCFDCSFWLKKINLPEEDEARRVIVNSQHYRLGSVHSGPFRGFGGRKFTVLFLDGRVVETCLWHQGQIPKEFRQWLPDNAVFLPVETLPALDADKSEIPF